MRLRYLSFGLTLQKAAAVEEEEEEEEEEAFRLCFLFHFK